MWIDDLAPFSYGSEPRADRLAVGWLDGAKPFERGVVGANPVHDRFVEVLRWAAVHRSVDAFRGRHYCDLDGCRQLAPGPEAVPTASFANRAMALGSAQIEVDGSGGSSYVAPNLIVHYVEVHGYRPPNAFVRAALVGDRRSPERVPGACRFVGPGVAIDDWSPELASVLWEHLAARLVSTTGVARDLVRVEVHAAEVECIQTRQGLPSVGVTMSPTATSWIKFRRWTPTLSGTREVAGWIAEALAKAL